MAIRVGIVEDDARLRSEFEQLVGSAMDMTCVCACASAEEAMVRMPAAAPDVVLMDLNLPGISGIECTRQLKTLRPEVEVVVLTSVDDPAAIFESLSAGASGYVLKRTSGLQILEAVRDVHNGGSPMTGAIARRVVQFFGGKEGTRRATPTAEPHPSVVTLTERERAVLDALAEGQQYKEIADTLAISINTVRKHIKGIYEKLHVTTRHDAVRKLGRF
jgi:DNA-binding NarL/FixJ family response regulator